MRITQRLQHLADTSLDAISVYGDVGWNDEETQGISVAVAFLDQVILAREAREGATEAQAVPLPVRTVEQHITERIQEQQQWIDEHGETEDGYVLRYGSRFDASHFGDGGEAIYAADTAELQKLIAERARLRHPSHQAIDTQETTS